MKKCSHCGEEFISNKKNQKYCNPACCRLATNKKIMQRYYEKKERLNGLKRFCSCGQLLSRYNDSDDCFVCLEKQNEKSPVKVKGVLDNVIKKINKTRR